MGQRSHCMLYASSFLVLLSSFAAFCQSIQIANFGGSGTEVATSVAVDAQGSVYMTGTTTSLALPVLNAFQTANRGTDLLVSRDSGRTWQALPNLPPTPLPPGAGNPPPVPVLGVSPSDPITVYAARGGTVYRSIDGLQTSNAIFSLQYATINGFALTPDAVYASANVPLGVFKSTDAGLTWSQAADGLPNSGPGGSIDSISIDPFHANTLWAWAGMRPELLRGGFLRTRARNAAASHHKLADQITNVIGIVLCQDDVLITIFRRGSDALWVRRTHPSQLIPMRLRQEERLKTNICTLQSAFQVLDAGGQLNFRIVEHSRKVMKTFRIDERDRLAVTFQDPKHEVGPKTRLGEEADGRFRIVIPEQEQLTIGKQAHTFGAAQRLQCVNEVLFALV